MIFDIFVMNSKDSEYDNIIGELIGSNTKYRIGEFIGNGKFGFVFKGYKSSHDKEHVAIKLERRDSQTTILKHETTILNHLYRNGSFKIPHIYWFGVFSHYNCLVMTYYKCSLENLFEQDKTKTIRLFPIMVSIVESIHKCFVIHRDIKPQNFMIGEDEQIYLIDFGMATIYVDENKKHVHQGESKKYILGNPKFMSYNIHRGCEPSRRDDLISLGYMYIYFSLQYLPWDKTHLGKQLIVENDVIDSIEWKNEMDIMYYKNIMIQNKKKRENIIDICSTISEEYGQEKIRKIIEYCYSLTYEQTPFYEGLYNMFLHP
jgi:serine/threonine protein kinase